MNQEKRDALYFKLMILCAAVFFNLSINAQTKPIYQITQAKQVVAFMDTVRKNMPVEKLYLHLDKHNYLAGDTLWFKAYLLEGPYLMPSAKSGIFYVELVSPDNRVMKRMKFPAKYGLGWGNISLDEEALPTGDYLLRAYTNWMLNFGEAAVYTTNIYISNSKIPAGPVSLKQQAKAGVVSVVSGRATDLAINNAPEKLDLEITITAEGAARDLPGYYLVGQSRGVICYAVPVNLKEGKVVNKIEKGLFPSGIARFTLMDKSLQPLNERLIYIDQHDQLNVNVSTAQTIYKGRDSIALRIRVTDKNNEPVQGSFSMGITDDNQVSVAKQKKGNLSTYILLASELKNQVKDAEDYSNGTVAAQQALDSLVKRSGWVGYNWKDVLNTEKPRYKAEPEFMITGRVNSTFSGMSEAKLSLFVKKPMLFMDTVADANGRFVFKNLPVTDTAVYKIQATNRKGKSFFANLEVDEWLPPVFSPIPANYSNAVVLKDTAFVQKVAKAAALKQEQDRSNGRLLNEVNIASKKRVKNSQNLNGSGEADQVLTEEDLLKEGKKSLLDLLMTRIPGLVRGGYKINPGDKDEKVKIGLKLKNQLVKFIMDGIDLDQGYEYSQPMADTSGPKEGPMERYIFIKSNLDNFTAEDVKGIEVMYNATYNAKYNYSFLSTTELNSVGGASGKDYTYIEITTRNGRGPFMKQTPGTYLYKPLAFSLPKKFHGPKYLNKDSTGIDIRSTVHWEPNIVTDEKGEAVISFYAADPSSSYTVVIEGSDMNGRMGSVIKPAFLKIAP